MLVIILIHVFSAFYWSFLILNKIVSDRDYINLKKEDSKIKYILRHYSIVYIIMNLLGMWIYVMVNYMRGKETTKDHINALKIIRRHFQK